MDKPEGSKDFLSSGIRTRSFVDACRINSREKKRASEGAAQSLSRQQSESDSSFGRESQNHGRESSKTKSTDKRHRVEKDSRRSDSSDSVKSMACSLSERRTHKRRTVDVNSPFQIPSQTTSQSLRDICRRLSSSEEQESSESKVDKQTLSSRKDRKEKSREERKMRNKENVSPSTSTDDTQQTRSEQEQLEDLIGDVRTAEKLRTFVIEEKPKPEKGVCLVSFTVVDHDDHWHIAFQSSWKDLLKTIRKICKFLNLSPASTAEALNSASYVRNYDFFGLFLLRSGKDRIKYYGTEHTTLANIIKSLIIRGCTAEATLSCPEMSRLERRDKSNIYILLDQLLDKYNPYTLSQFERSLPKHDFLTLMVGLETNYREQVSALIEYRRKDLYDLIENSTLEENLKRVSRLTPNLNNMDWLEYMFKENKIALPEFLAWMKIISERRIEKVNTLVLDGTTNSGKSLILRSIMQNLNIVYVTKTNSDGGFKLQDLLEKNFAILEEPHIEPTNLDYYKRLLGGEYRGVPVCYFGNELLPRIPIFICTYLPLGNFLPFQDGRSLQSRTKTFYLQKEIRGVGDCSNLIGYRLKPPPLNINEADWLGLLRKYKREIEGYTVNIISGQHSNINLDTILTRDRPL